LWSGCAVSAFGAFAHGQSSQAPHVYVCAGARNACVVCMGAGGLCSGACAMFQFYVSLLGQFVRKARELDFVSGRKRENLRMLEVRCRVCVSCHHACRRVHSAQCLSRGAVAITDRMPMVCMCVSRAKHTASVAGVRTLCGGDSDALLQGHRTRDWPDEHRESISHTGTVGWVRVDFQCPPTTHARASCRFVGVLACVCVCVCLTGDAGSCAFSHALFRSVLFFPFCSVLFCCVWWCACHVAMTGPG